MFFDQISEVINKTQWNMGLAKKKKKKKKYMGIKFTRTLVFADWYLKTKIKFPSNKIIKNFDGISPKEGLEFFCLLAKSGWLCFQIK